MIVKTLQVSHGKRLAAHLTNAEDNERVLELGARDTFAQDVRGAIDEMSAIARGTRCKRHLVHAIMNPPPGVEFSDEQWQRAWQLYEAEFGLEDRQYVEVAHQKEGHVHRHRVYERVDAFSGRAVQMSWTHVRNEKIARRIEFEFGLPVTAGRHNYAVARRLREEGHHQVVDYMAAAGVHQRRRPQAQAIFEHAQRAKRTGVDPRDVQAQLREAFEASDSAQAFAAALAEHGLQLAQGRKVPVVIDRAGEAHPVLRALKRAGLDLRKRDLDARLEGLQLRPADDVALEVRLSAPDLAAPTRVSASKPDAQKTLSKHDAAQERLAAKLAEQLLGGGGRPPAGGYPAAAPPGLGQGPALAVGQEFSIDGEIRLLAAKLTDAGLSAAARRELEKTLELKQREKADARRREQEARITAPRPVSMPLPQPGASPVLHAGFNPVAWAWLAPTATRYGGRISAPRPVPAAKVRRRRYQDDTYAKPVMRGDHGHEAEHPEAARNREAPDGSRRRDK